MKLNVGIGENLINEDQKATNRAIWLKNSTAEAGRSRYRGRI